MKNTIYILPTNPDFYGAKTEEEGARCAGVLGQELSWYIAEQAYYVELKKALLSDDCRGEGDAEIIHELECFERMHIKEWLKGVL